MKGHAKLFALLAGGLMLLTPALDGARADHNANRERVQQYLDSKGLTRHRQQMTDRRHAYAYGKWARNYYGDQRDGGGFAYGKRGRAYFGHLPERRHRGHPAHARHHHAWAYHPYLHEQARIRHHHAWAYHHYLHEQARIRHYRAHRRNHRWADWRQRARP